ncbi:MAG: hypothetical protein ACRCY0_04805, partial [Synechococcus elongatus]|uniref:hypothetical protein n=1 Tax=Synechococcus elongatus TaxID=32046 RepID=UPI003F3D34E8
ENCSKEKTLYFTQTTYFPDFQKCRRVVETSNIETEDSSTMNKKRPHKKPPRFLSEPDSSSDGKYSDDFGEYFMYIYFNKIKQGLDSVAPAPQTIISTLEKDTFC